MLVKNRMTKDVVSIDEKEPMVRAIELIKTRKIAKLPVTKEGNVVGIISGEDIKIVYPSEDMFNDPEELEFAKSWNKHIVIRCKHGQGAVIGASSMWNMGTRY